MILICLMRTIKSFSMILILLKPAGDNFLRDLNLPGTIISKILIPGKYPSEFKVINLINGYRQRGHLFTKTNPVRTRRKYTPTLDIENFGLTKDDLIKDLQSR